MWRTLLRDPGPDDHLVQFYDDPRFLQAAVGAWLTPALDRGGAIVLASPERARMTRRALRHRGIDVERAEAEGRLVVLDAYDLLAEFMKDGRPRAEVFKHVLAEAVQTVRGNDGDREIRAWGEAVDILRRNQNVYAAHFLEALWNEAIDEHRLRLLCSYRVDTLEPASHPGTLHDLAARHGTLIPVADYVRLNDAVERALSDIIGPDAASSLLAELWQRSPPIRMPIGERVLLFMEETRPALAVRLFTRTRRYYGSQSIPLPPPRQIQARMTPCA